MRTVLHSPVAVLGSEVEQARDSIDADCVDMLTCDCRVSLSIACCFMDAAVSAGSEENQGHRQGPHQSVRGDYTTVG